MVYGTRHGRGRRERIVTEVPRFPTSAYSVLHSPVNQQQAAGRPVIHIDLDSTVLINTFHAGSPQFSYLVPEDCVARSVDS